MHVKAEWQLQDAKANLSRIMDRALDEGPQRINRHGRAAAIVLSERDFERLRRHTRGALATFLARSALRGLDLDVRDHDDTGRHSLL